MAFFPNEEERSSVDEDLQGSVKMKNPPGLRDNEPLSWKKIETDPLLEDGEGNHGGDEDENLEDGANLLASLHHRRPLMHFWVYY